MLQLFRYDFNLGINSPQKPSLVSIYPNPTSHYINFKTPYQIENLSIFDVSGRLIKENYTYINKEIDISELSTGTYLIQMKIDGKYVSKKLIKE